MRSANRRSNAAASDSSIDPRRLRTRKYFNPVPQAPSRPQALEACRRTRVNHELTAPDDEIVSITCPLLEILHLFRIKCLVDSVVCTGPLISSKDRKDIQACGHSLATPALTHTSFLSP